MGNIYHQLIKIPCYDTDASQLLKPVSFMNYAQELANLHASELGFGYDDMIRTRTAWVLSRMHIKFFEYPIWRDSVNLRTWHKGPERLFYLRDFEMRDASDEKVLAVATTSWLVINMDTRRLTRDALLDEESVRKVDAISPSCDKVKLPSDLTPTLAATHTIGYSDVDLNGHANNAMYLLWAMDAAGCGVSLHKPLKEVKLNFNHEIRPGEKVELYVCSGTSQTSGDSMTAATTQDSQTTPTAKDEEIFWVEGRLPGSQGSEAQSSFVVEMKF